MLKKKTIVNKNKKNLFERLIDTKDGASSKRFLGLIMSAFLIFTSVYILFVDVPERNVVLVDRVLLYSMLIVTVSILGMSIDKVADILLNISKTQGAAKILAPSSDQNNSASTQTIINTAKVDEDTGEQKKVVETLKQNNDIEGLRKNLINSLTEE